MTVMFLIAILSDGFRPPWRAPALATRRSDGNTPSMRLEATLSALTGSHSAAFGSSAGPAASVRRTNVSTSATAPAKRNGSDGSQPASRSGT